MLETYLNNMAGVWKNVIVAGSGNEGAGRGHAAGNLQEDEVQLTEFAISEYETVLNLQLWKNYADEFDVTVIAPSGERTVIRSSGKPGIIRARLSGTELLIYYGEPSPYSADQEIYLDFIPEGRYLTPGIWGIELLPQRIRDGAYDLWLPGIEAVNEGTGFLRPSAETTLTIPSTAEKVLTAGAYNSRTGSYAYFSGRGDTRFPRKRKPDLVAPGVDIRTTASGGGYAVVSGTSFAAPFVSAAAALLMQWGIVEGNDPYLYGDKVKAYLRRGARPLPEFADYPNEQVGYGALCTAQSLPKI